MLKAMKRNGWLGVGGVWVVAGSMAAAAPSRSPDDGAWRPLSTTARGVTGDIVLGDEKLTINFTTFPLAEIRILKPEEATAAFPADTAGGGGGELYRVSIPAEKKFLHKNTLCGSEETQWVATYVEGKTLHLSLFSGPKMPVFTPEAMADGSNVCGTFSYVR